MLKTCLILALACLTLPSGTQAQAYRWKTTLSNQDGVFTNTFTSVDCSGKVCTAAGIRKNDTLTTIDRNVVMFYRSTDGGQTWVEQDPGLPHFRGDNQYYFITKVEQIDSLNIVGVGDTGLIVRSTDGGNSWTKQDLHTNGNVLDVHFSDPLTGIVVCGDSSDILTTTDGGINWVLASFKPWVPSSMCHSNGGGSFLVCMLGGETVYTTTDNWNIVDSLPPIISWSDDTDVIGLGKWRFLDPDTIVAYGGHLGEGALSPALILRSTDGGQSWFNTNVPDSIVKNLESMSSLAQNITFCVGWTDFPHLLSSTDHGATWNVDTLEFDTIGYIPQFVNAVAVTSRNEAIVIFGGITVATSSTLLVRGTPVSAEVAPTQETDEQTMNIFPNPATSSISIFNFSGALTITDPLGRNYVVKQTGNTLDISALPSGVYFVSDGNSQAKFVKE